MSIQFENRGAGLLKNVVYFDASNTFPPLDHDGVATIDMRRADISMPKISAVFETLGVSLVKTGSLYTEAAGPEAIICFSGDRDSVHQKLLSDPEMVADPTTMRKLAFPDW